MKLKVLGRYENGPRNINVYPGDEIEVKDELAEWLMNDAPGCFEDPTGKLKPRAANQLPDDAARREATAIVDRAQQILATAQQEAARLRAEAGRVDEQKPFDLPPDGTTLKTDVTPSVVTGPDSGAEVTHRADADEQQAVLEQQAQSDEQKRADEPVAEVIFEPAPAFVEGIEEEEEEKTGKAKAPKGPPKNKAVQAPPEQKAEG